MSNSKEFRYLRNGEWSGWLPFSCADELEDVYSISAIECKERMTYEKVRELYPEAFSQEQTPNK